MKRQPAGSKQSPRPPDETAASPLWLPKWAAVLGLLAWIFYSGRAYFGNPDHNPGFAQSLEAIINTPYFDIFGAPFSLLASHLAHWAWTLAFLFISFHIGDLILRRYNFFIKLELMEFSLATGLGIFILAMVIFLLLTLHAVYMAPLILLFGLALAASLYRQKTFYPAFIPSRNTLLGWTKFPLSEKLALAVFMLFAGTLFMSSFAPEVFYDSLVYHLALPYLWFHDHYFTPLPFLAFSTMPTLVQLNYIWGFAAESALPFLHGDTIARMVHFSMGLLTITGIYGFVQPRWGRFCALLTAVFFYAIPIITMNSWTSGNDVGAGLYQMLGVLLLLLWNEDPAAPKKYWVLSALFVGAALGSKYTAIFGAAATFLVAAYFNFRRSEGWKAKLLPGLNYGLLMLLAWSPWLIKNIIYTGNPIHPFMFGYFGGQNISDALKWQGSGKDVFVANTFNIFQLKFFDFIKGFFISFWRVAMNGTDSVRYAGPLLLLFGPAILLFKKWHPAAKITCWIFGLAYFFWFMGADFARYLAPAYPCLAITLAYVWTRIQDLFPREIKLSLMAVPLGVALAVWSPMANIVHHIHAPWAILTGKLSRENYLSYSRASYPNPSYKVYQYINQNIPDKGSKFLLVGDNKAYGLMRSFNLYTIEYNNAILHTWIRDSKDETELYQKFKEDGITHLVINFREFSRLHPETWKERDLDLLDKFWKKHVREMPYFAEATFVYEILPELDPQSAPAHNYIAELNKRGFKSSSLLQSLLELGDWDHAADEAESWVRMGSPVFDILADIYQRRNKPGDEERTIEALRAAIPRNPQNINLAKRLLSLHIKRNERDAALQVASYGAQSYPSDPDFQRILQALSAPPK